MERKALCVSPSLREGFCTALGGEERERRGAVFGQLLKRGGEEQ